MPYALQLFFGHFCSLVEYVQKVRYKNEMNNEKRKKKKHKVWYTLTVNNDNSANYTANSKAGISLREDIFLCGYT